MRILVTGASGFVGGAIARQLAVEKGREVIGLSRRGPFQADLSNLDFVSQVTARLAPCDIIVHAAAALNKELLAPEIPLVNCLGTRHVIELAQRWGTKTLVYLSGVSVAGRPGQIPVEETHPVAPASAYLASKFFGEILTGLASSPNRRSVILRLTAPIGPGMPPNRILSTFVRRALDGRPLQILGQGTRKQDYVDARDAAMAVELVIAGAAEGLFNIGSGKSISNLALAELCVRQLNSSSTIEFSGRTDPEEGINWDVSIAKAVAALGYGPRWALSDSIQAVAEEMAASVKG